MKQLFKTMLKDEPSLVLCTPSNDKQIILDSMPIPSSETEFKKFFHVSTMRIEKQNQTHVCIGCHVLSNRSLGNIKHKSKENQILAWLKKERVFVESDSLGIEHPTTIGYFTKIVPTLTHLANFREHLTNQLLLIELDADTAVELAPHLKQAQLDAMTNGDEFVPILPNFEVYRTRITHGRANAQVMTDVLGVKGAPKDAKLLREFFTRMAAETSTDNRDGVFILTGAVHLLGVPTYEQVLKENNFFLNNVATIPINLEHQAWFSILDPNQTSETEPISLYDHLIRQSWFLRIESVTRNKCLILTTKSNLPAARMWIDENLEPMIRKSIPPGIDPPSSLLPRRLDKPVYTATSKTYADILKQQFSLTTNPTTDNGNNRPPRKRQAMLLDYDSDQSAEYPPLPKSSTSHATSNNRHNNPTTQATETVPTTYATDLLQLKEEINQLKTLIVTAVEQITAAIASFQKIPNPSSPNAMDIDADYKSLDNPPTSNETHCETIEISDAIQELQLELKQLTQTTQAFTQQKLPTQQQPNHHHSLDT